MKSEGVNSRLDGLQAAILSVKLKHIKAWNKSRFEMHFFISFLVGNKNIVIPKISKGASHVFHLYVIRCKDREGLMKHLKDLNIGKLYPLSNTSSISQSMSILIINIKTFLYQLIIVKKFCRFQMFQSWVKKIYHLLLMQSTLFINRT